MGLGFVPNGAPGAMSSGAFSFMGPGRACSAPTSRPGPYGRSTAFDECSPTVPHFLLGHSRDLHKCGQRYLPVRSPDSVPLCRTVNLDAVDIVAKNRERTAFLQQKFAHVLAGGQHPLACLLTQET